MHSEACKSVSLGESYLMFNGYVQNTGALRNEFEVRFQYFKFCEVEFAIFTAPFNFDVKKITQSPTNGIQ